jgi:hypothetical protein
MGITWLKGGIWKLRGIRREFERKHSTVSGREEEEEEAKHIPLKCSEKKKWREKFVCSNWLNVK